jgi:PDZ domain-containing protein
VILKMLNKLYENFKKFIKENYKFLLALILIFIFFFTELPFVVYKPGGVINLDERIVMEDKYESSGSLSMSYVSMMKGNIPFVLLSYIIPNWDLMPASDVTLDDESVDEAIARDRVFLEEGLDNATIAAYNLADKEINIEKIDSVIAYISSDANTDLKIGDIIVSIDEKQIDDLEDLQKYINTLNSGDKVTIKVKRDEKEVSCSATIYELDGSLKVGVYIANKYEYTLNPELEIKTKESESGSSGGLMTALAIYNSLVEEDITKGRNIVGTGTIDIDGNVGEIGGVKYKLLGAEKNKADIFLCPLENYEEAIKVKEENNLDLEVVSVSTLKEAIEYLEK